MDILWDPSPPNSKTWRFSLDWSSFHDIIELVFFLPLTRVQRNWGQRTYPEHELVPFNRIIQYFEIFVKTQNQKFFKKENLKMFWHFLLFWFKYSQINWRLWNLKKKKNWNQRSEVCLVFQVLEAGIRRFLTKPKNRTSMHILPLEMKGLVSIMPRLLYMREKKRKDTPMPKLQVLSTKNPTTTKKATNNSHRRRRKPHSANWKWRACWAIAIAI